jgi:4-amino-4-deoxy-L-arabinose transferase-like glycosyltransferase
MIRDCLMPRLSLPAALGLGMIPHAANALLRGLWAPDEPRVAQVAREAWLLGDFVTLRLCGEPYPDKPPLTFLLTAIPGALTDWALFAMRLPSLVAVLVTAWCVARLAQTWLGRDCAAPAALAFLSLPLVLHLGGRLQHDTLLTCFVLGAITARTNLAPGRRRDLLVALLTALASLTKGPVAFWFVASWIALARRSRGERLTVRPVPILIAVGPLLGWAGTASAREPDRVGELLFASHLGRVFAARSHAGHFYEPLLEVLLFALPVSFLAIGALRRSPASDEAEDPAEALLRGARDWLVVNLIVFTLIAEKREVYLLPCYPLLVILAVASVRDGRRSVWLRIGAFVPMLLALVLATAPTAIAHFAPRFTGLAPNPWIVVPLGLGLASAALLVARDALHRPPLRALTNLHTVLIGAALLAAVAILPRLDPHKAPDALAAILAARPEQPTTIPCVGVRPEAYRFLTDRPVVADQAATKIAAAFDRDGDDFLAMVWTRDLERIPAPVRAGTITLANHTVGGREIVLLGRRR